ncbi:MAG: hypothetical protein PWP65_356 [Clostridia bacterium]|nr:hypothetical protein [Clostridia bacterium]
MMPGPLLMVTVNESSRRGALAGPLVVLGHGLLELALVLALTLGLGLFLSKPLVGRSTAVVGGAVLLWMGWAMLRGAISGKVTLELAGKKEELKRPSFWLPVAAGAVTSLANPYWLLWWVTIGAAFVAQAWRYGIGGLTSFFAGHICSDLLWYSLVALAVAAGRRFIGAKIYSILIAGCGIFLMFLAVYFLYAGWTGNVKL